MSDERRWVERWEGATRAPSGVWKERRRLAAAMRSVIERLITSDAPEEELRIAADRLEGYAERLAGHPRRKAYEGFSESATAGAAPEAGGHFDFSPLIGRANPLAPPIVMHSEGMTVRGKVIFGTAYEGPPGCVHGGVVAAAFDEVLGYAQALTGEPGMTGSLTIRYRKPTPLHAELRFHAEVDRVDGRKKFASGTLHAGETLCAEASGIFISIDRGRFVALMEERARRGGS